MDQTSRRVLAQTGVVAPDQRDRPVPFPAGRAGPGRAGGHRRCPASPTRAPDWLATVKHAAYLLIVKANQRSLHHQLATLPRRAIPIADHTRDRGHGRTELRRLQSPPSLAWLPSRRPGDPHHPPGPAACRPVMAGRDGVRGHQPHRRPGPPRPPRELPARPLGHRGAAPPPRHHLRRGRLPGPHRQHTQGHGQPAQPLAIGILRLHRRHSIAAALRRNARDGTRVLPLLGITSP
jgi:hypothetical protein